MLLYAWDLARYKDCFKVEVEKSPQLLGLLALVLAHSVESLLRRGLARSFRTEVAEVDGLRGKLHLGESLLRQSFWRGKTVCGYPVLSLDSLKNRILRSTLARIAGDPRLEVGGKSEAVEQLLHKIRAVARQMEGIPLIRPQTSDFRSLQLTRNDEPYRLPLLVCSLIHRLEMPTESSGDTALTSLLRDEITFSNLFERFVRNFYKHHLHGCEVASEVLEWGDELECKFVPSMLTDISLTFPDGRRFVIDTKYYRDYLTTQYDGAPKFHSNNLYQMYAYLRTQEHRGAAHQHCEGILIYPSCPGTFSAVMKVQGHRIRIETVDLTEPWEAIECRLLALVAPSTSGLLSPYLMRAATS